jgi:hypothetical protein
MDTKIQVKGLPSRAIACAVAACLSLVCFVVFLHRLFFVRGPITIGSHFMEGPSPMELLGAAGILMAGTALACCVWSWRREPLMNALAATLVTAHALVVWGLLFLALWK